MLHVKQIKQIIAEGKPDEALEAIERLLVLGPGNLEALKLRAQIYASQGRFQEEAQAWRKVLTVDREDKEAIDFILRQQRDDREHFYFSDPLPQGGRRYFAYPRQLMYTSALGLFGCTIFFALSRLLDQEALLSEPFVILGMFFVLVFLPWVAIIWGWARSLKSFDVTPTGLVAHTRFGALEYRWRDRPTTTLAFAGDPFEPDLFLVIQPSDPAQLTLVVDLGDSTSSLRAVSYILREIEAYCPRLEHGPLRFLKLDPRSTRTY